MLDLMRCSRVPREFHHVMVVGAIVLACLDHV